MISFCRASESAVTSKAKGEVAAELVGRNPAVEKRLMLDAAAPGRWYAFWESRGYFNAEPEGDYEHSLEPKPKYHWDLGLDGESDPGFV